MQRLPTSQPEAELTAQLADASFRLARLDHHEQELMAQAAGRSRDEGTAARLLQIAKNVLEVGDVLLRELQVQVNNEIHAEQMALLSPLLQLVANSAEVLNLPVQLRTDLEEVVQVLRDEALLGAGTETVSSVRVGVEALLSEVRKLLPTFEAAAAEESKNILPAPLAVDDKLMRKLHVYRTRLFSVQERVLGILRQMRELPQAAEGHQGAVTFELNLRVVGHPR